MTEPSNPLPTPPAADKAQVEALIAECIEAMEKGEADPASRLCATRPDLLTRVQRRLAQLVARGLVTAPHANIPAAIGPYEIVRELGAGGMGTVYLAEQREPVRRQVALKVIKLGMDTREVVARFQAERQALALMSHPHIAQVFDAGITGDGRPFFAMEYVAGKGLLQFCDERQLPTTARMRLLATICRAVQHAHDRGFIHRDLKPSNVLVAEVDGQFVPKVIDFGIAKAAANAALADVSLHTRADQVLGTPEYMSPEHARSGGLDVDTRADVYSLGVVLYELLCGELPFDSRRLRRAPRDELERILADELPTLPSKRLSLVGQAALDARGGERGSLQRSVAGDLDWITLRALAKQRDERYPSALALAEDLERWLEHEPVLAAPPGHTYRLRKFVQRHRVAVTAAAAVLVALITGLVVSLRATWQAEQARAQEAAARGDMRAFYDMARTAVGNLVDVADKDLADVPQAENVRRRLLADAMTFYDGLRARQAQDLELRIDIAAAEHQVGRLQRRLGASKDATATLAGAVADVDRLLREAPHDLRLHALAVEARNDYAGALQSSGRTDEARQLLRDALAALATARRDADGTIVDGEELEATLLANFAWFGEGAPSQQIAEFERALAAFAKITKPRASDVELRTTTVLRYAEALTKVNRTEEAAHLLTETSSELGGNLATAPPRQREMLAQIARHTATVLRRLGRRPEAIAAQQRVIELFHALTRDFPEAVTFADGEAAGWHTIAQMQLDGAEPGLAAESAKKAVAIRERLAADHPQDHRLRARLVRTLMQLSSAELDLWQKQGGDERAALATLTKASAIADELVATHGDDIESLIVYSGTRSGLGNLHMHKGELNEALQEHLAVRDALTATLPKHPDDPELRYLLASASENALKVQFQLGDFAAAAASGKAGLEQVEAGLRLDATSSTLRELVAELAAVTVMAQQRSGDLDGAIATMIAMCERADFGQEAHEQGCLILHDMIQHVPDDRHDELLQRAAVEMRKAIAARGTLAEALARPPQVEGTSHPGSRLRDFDLRLAFGDMLRELGEHDEQSAVIAEAEQIATTLPKLAGGRVRNLADQRAVLQIEAGDATGAAATIESMLQRVGDDGGAFYMAAVLFTACRAKAQDAAAKEALAVRAVTCLRQSLEHDEVPADATGSDSFASLRGRPDYEALLAK